MGFLKDWIYGKPTGEYRIVKSIAGHGLQSFAVEYETASGKWFVLRRSWMAWGKGSTYTEAMEFETEAKAKKCIKTACIC